MASLIHRVFRGSKAAYQVVGVLKDPSILKARVLSVVNQPDSPSILTPGSPVIIKDVVFKREPHNHALGPIVACKHFRQMQDVITEGGVNAPKKERMVLEWMDTDLWQIRQFENLKNSRLLKAVARSVLEALTVTQSIGAVHTDINPNNILLSDIASPYPVVKVGDLGQMIMEGIKKPRGQSLETRAPEVWRGLGLWPASDVWSLGVTMVHWLISRCLFGPSGKVVEGHTEAWCIAKLRRLIGPIEPPENSEYEDEFSLAQFIEQSSFDSPDTGEHRPFLLEQSLREELMQLPRNLCPVECIEFIEHLMVVDHTKRPTAAEALEHPFLKIDS